MILLSPVFRKFGTAAIVTLTFAALQIDIEAAPITTTEALVAAVRDAKAGTTVEIGAGTFELSAPLEPKSGVSVKGAGIDKTIITHTAGWKPSTKSLPDPEMKLDGLDTSAYLIRLPNKSTNITISDLTLTGPQLHGAIFSFNSQGLHLHHLKLEDFLWASIRTFATQNGKIHDCEFINAGGRWKRGGELGVKGGITGGAIFAIWLKDTEIWNNRFTRTYDQKEREFYGIKVRQGKRVRVHHNTIDTNSFALEFPFENDEDVEIDHNVLHGVVSIPKHGGGPVPESGSTFHIHHNWFTTSYAIEFPRNGVEIHHNLFDFKTESDGGNLISGFGGVEAKGPASFHNNLVNNPGRGVIWIERIFNHLEIRNNHIVTRTTATPRKEGLFALHGGADFSTIVIKNNLIECIGQERPLLRNDPSGGAKIENNSLTNVSDTARYKNPKTDEKQGLEKPLKFKAGVSDEYSVNGWKAELAE